MNQTAPSTPDSKEIERPLKSTWLSQEGRPYFEVCQTHLIHHLGNPVESTFWETLVLQISQQEPAVSYGLSALGACFVGRSSIDGLSVNANTIRLRREACLRFYNDALAITAKRMESSNGEIVALVTCALFLCIEFLHGNIDRALDLLTYGHNILQKYLARNKQDLPLQHQSTFELTIVPLYERLIVLSTLFRRHLAPVRPPLLLGQRPSSTTQGSFTTIYEARDSLYQIMNEANGFLKQTHVWRRQIRSTTAIPERWIEEQSALLDTPKVWLKMTNGSYRPAHGRSLREQRLETLLLLYHASAVSRLKGSLSLFEACYESHLHLFNLILEYAENLQCPAASGIMGDFTFEMGVLGPVYHTAMKCRYPQLRRRAIRCMRQAPKREALWNRSTRIAIGTRLMEIEEDGIDDPSESMRPVQPMVVDVSIESEDDNEIVAKMWSPNPTGDGCKTWTELIKMEPIA